MGRTRNPRRDEALRQYILSSGTKKPKEIAEFLKVPPSQVRKWKTEDKWDELLALPPEKRNLPKKRGPGYGNKNAVGNKGGHGVIGNKGGHGAPIGSKNAEKTGEYSTITLDTLSDEEKILYNSIADDPMVLIDENIRLLKIRERRMLWNLENIKSEKDALTIEETHVVWEKGDAQDSPTRREITKKKQLLIDKIISCEEAITRVQDKLLKAIETKQRMLKEQAEQVGGNQNAIQFTFDR